MRKRSSHLFGSVQGLLRRFQLIRRGNLFPTCRLALGRGFSLGLLAAMLLSFFPVGVATASAPVPPSPTEVLPDWWVNEPAPQDTTAEIEPLLLETLAVEGTADFFIWMEEKADLSAAYELESKEEKGQFVYETLVATAERTQAGLRGYLDRQGIDYRPFYIANKILVRGGDLALVTAVAERPDVARITANHEFQLEEPFIDPLLPVQHTLAVESNISFINADDVWALGIDGTGIVLAGNDTGLDWDHPALIGHYRGWDGSTADHNYSWWDATDTYPNVPGDGHGHGTHTGGTMVGDDGADNQIGVAPGARLVHCKNLTDGGSTTEAMITECFEWDLAPWDLSGANPRPDLAPDAINNSWSWSSGGDSRFVDEIAALEAAGILVEFSAGGGGSSCATLRSPADYPQVLTTGSVNQTGGVLPGTISSFSGRGPSPLYPDGYKPDVMAPGDNIRSSAPDGGYAIWSGTSMAGPHATALAALVWQANPALRGQVSPTLQIILDTAVPLTGQYGSNCGGNYVEGPNNDWGHGTIDALAAVERARAFGDNGYLDGTVTDSSNSNPIEGVTVTAVREEGVSWNADTDATGYYTMTVANGTFTVTAAHPQYETAVVTGVVVTTDTVTTVDFSLTPRGRLFGTVTDYDNGFPLAATIVVSGVGTVETDPAAGTYEMYLDAGTYEVTALDDGYLPETTTVSISSGGDTQQDFTLLAEVSFIPIPVEVTVLQGFTTSLGVTVTNRLTIPYAFQFLELPGGFVPIALDDPGVLTLWPGPDGFGYVGEEVGYRWVDIAASGTPVALGDDTYSGPLPVGFTFNLYGTDYTQFYIASNGYVSFGGGSSDMSNDCPLPNANAPSNIVALMWDDLNPYATGDLVYYQSFPACPVGSGACLVVQYEDYHHFGGAIAGTFEAVLFDNGSILVQFEDAGDERGSHSTMGIEGSNAAGDHGLTYACNVAGSLVDNTAVCFVYPGSVGCEATEIPWIGQEPISGTVPATGNLPVTLNFTATGAAGIDQPGDYAMTLVVWGDREVRVPVTMTVVPTMPLCSFEANSPVVLGETMVFTNHTTGLPPISYRWDFGDGVGTSTETHPTYTYTSPGTFTVTLVATNTAGTDSVAHPVVVTCVDLTGVTILGPVAGEPGVYTFTTTYTPGGAMPPIEYVWDNGDVLSTSVRTLDVGVHTLVVTATNCVEGLVVDTHTITVSPPCTDVIGVDLTQVTTGTIYTATLMTFRVDILPDDAGKPYTYTVDFGVGVSPPALSSDDPLTLTHTYAATGTYDVAIAVWNCDMTIPVTDTLQVTVVEREEVLNYLYLPIVLKDF